MNQADANRVSIQSAQLVMRQAGADIVADGKWGSFTQGVYAKASPAVRAVVDTVLRSGGTSASALSAARAAQKAAGILAQKTVGTDVRAAIRAAADEAGLPVSLLEGFAKIESNFNPRATNGSSRGLMQMQPAAWADARKALPSLPGYDEGVFDPLQNARAGAAYIKINIRALAKRGYEGPMDAATLYMAHQQGAGGFMELWKFATGRSTKVRYVTNEAMLGNPPQDGKGKTTNRKEFYERWMDAARKKIAG